MLYTGNVTEEVCLLGLEASNKGVLDSGCTSSVCGKEWLRTYLSTLSKQQLATVVWGAGEKHFKFGAGSVLKSIGTAKIPCSLAGTHVRLHIDVVDSNIPLLISKRSMKKAGGVLDLVNDKVKLFDKWIACDLTSSGHYAVSLGTEEVSLDTIEVSLFSIANMDTVEQKKAILKLHRQFSHPTKQRFIEFLKKANKWDPEYQNVVNEIYSQCHMCKVFQSKSCCNSSFSA